MTRGVVGGGRRIALTLTAAALSLWVSPGQARADAPVWIGAKDYAPFSYFILPATYLADGRQAFWDVGAGFSATANPNAEWSYGWAFSRVGPFQLSPNSGEPLLAGVPGWFNLTNGLMPCVVLAPVDVSFPALGTGVTLPAGKVGLQPDSLGKFACVKWTCPQDGQYRFDAQFTGRSTAEVGNADVAVLRDGIQLFWSNVRDPRQISLLQVTFDLTAGETMDFRVGKGTDTNQNDLKQLDVVIQRVPRICVGDINGDGAVNTADLAFLLGQFGQGVPPSDGGDINGDGLIDTADLFLLLGNLGCTR